MAINQAGGEKVGPAHPKAVDLDFDPRDTDHPAGEHQAAENAENDPPS
jgi:hypothetical protein